MNINRREAVQRVVMLMGGVVSAPAMAGLRGEKLNHGAFVQVTAEQESLLAEVADVIIPSSSTPGAKAAGVEKFIVRVVRDCYPKEDQEHFYAGLAKLEANCQAKTGKSFTQANAVEKKDILTGIMLESDAERTANRGKKAPTPFFFMMKELTTTGYFTSEIGATKALEYLPIPGKFDGCMPLAPGQKTWAL
nr:gluconate 2-dehydrogenase subunit 3 family protein [Aquirufa rosea]